jgi:hypothetical protein
MFPALNLTKNGEIDKDLHMQYLDRAINDSIWLPIIKQSVSDCIDEVKRDQDTIVEQYEDPPMAIDRDECDVKFLAVVQCRSALIAAVSWI